MKTSNMGLMNRLVEYVRHRGKCFLGEVEVQLGMPIRKQYVLARAYRDFFQDVILERSRWRLIAIKEPVVVPLTSQNSLSHEEMGNPNPSRRAAQYTRGNVRTYWNRLFSTCKPHEQSVCAASLSSHHTYSWSYTVRPSLRFC